MNISSLKKIVTLRDNIPDSEFKNLIGKYQNLKSFYEFSIFKGFTAEFPEEELGNLYLNFYCISKIEK